MRPFKLDIEEIIEIARPSRKEGKALDKIVGFASLENARPGDLCFFDIPTYVAINPIYEKQLAECRASVILVPEKMDLKAKHGQLLLFVAKPTFALALICRKIEQQLFPKPSAGIHPSAVVDREADVHPDAHVGPLCYVGHHARIHAGAILHGGCTVRSYAEIGAGSELKSGVRVMDDCVIGKRCVLHSGAVIGSDGFGFATVEGEHIKIPQIGNVVVEDDVEIGANTTIDRARFGTTRIGHGTKIDNLVQIAHNVTIGKGCFITAQVGIAGSATLGDYVVMAGQSGIAGHVKVGSFTQVGGQAGVNHDWPEKSIINGTPAMEMQKNYRIEALKRRLPDLFKRVSTLEDKGK